MPVRSDTVHASPLAPDHLFGAWKIETISSGPGVGSPNAIAVTSSEVIYVIYFDYQHHYLMVARNLGSGWTNNALRSTRLFGGSISLAIDSYDRPHMVYCELLSTFNPICDTLWYTWDDGGAWFHEILDDSGGASEEVGTSATLALDSNDGAHVGEYVTTTQDLRYVFYDRVNPPVITRILTQGTAAAGAELRVWGDRPHITYVVDHNVDYAWQDAAHVWRYAPVTDTRNASLTGSLGHCHHSNGQDDFYFPYYDAVNHRVMITSHVGPY